MVLVVIEAACYFLVPHCDLLLARIPAMFCYTGIWDPGKRQDVPTSMILQCIVPSTLTHNALTFQWLICPSMHIHRTMLSL